MEKEMYGEVIAKELLAIGAVELSPAKPFQWASGLYSPIYTDNRLIISYPNTRLIVAEALVATINEIFPEVEVIAGTATAGIPHAAIVAHLLNLPMVYVRSSAKDHGKKNAIEGTFKKGSKVLMIEDLISTGQSVIQAADAIEAEGGQVIGCLAIFSYLMKQSEEAFKEKEYQLKTLTNYQILVDVATKDSNLQPYKETLEQWYQDPVSWSKQF